MDNTDGNAISPIEIVTAKTVKDWDCRPCIFKDNQLGCLMHIDAVRYTPCGGGIYRFKHRVSGEFVSMDNLTEAYTNHKIEHGVLIDV
jgi:hypothetical protein